MILAGARIKKPTGSGSRQWTGLARRAQVHVAALGLDVDMAAAVAGLEFEARTGPIVGTLRLRTEAAVDIAAEGLNVELGPGSRGEIEAQIAADRFALELGVPREREGGGHIARDGLEPAAAHDTELNLGVAAHGDHLDLCRGALEIDIAVDGLRLDRLGAGRGQVDGPGDAVGTQIGTHL